MLREDTLLLLLIWLIQVIPKAAVALKKITKVYESLKVDFKAKDCRMLINPYYLG